MLSGKSGLGKFFAALVALTGMALWAGSGAVANAASHRQPPLITSHNIHWRFGESGCSGGFCGQYLQISHDGTGNGAFAEIRNGPGDSNETWEAIFFPSNGEYAFKNDHSHKCLNDRNNHPSGHVDQWSCGTYPSDNRWFENPGFPHTWALESVSNGESACVFSSDRWVTFGAVGSGSCFWH